MNLGSESLGIRKQVGQFRFHPGAPLVGDHHLPVSRRQTDHKCPGRPPWATFTGTYLDLGDRLCLLGQGQLEGSPRNHYPENTAFHDSELPASLRCRPQNRIVRLNSAQQQIRTHRYLKARLLQIQQAVSICFEFVQLLNGRQRRTELVNVHLAKEVADVDLSEGWCDPRWCENRPRWRQGAESRLRKISGLHLASVSFNCGVRQ